MPPRSKVEQLPEDVFEELKKRLVDSAFSDYRGHAEWLASKGFEIRKSAVANFGQGYEAEREAMRMSLAEAREIVQEFPDDEGAMNDALQRLVGHKLYTAMRDPELDWTPKTLAAFARATADIGRATIQQKKHMAEFQRKAGDVIADMAKATGMSAEDAANWRARLIGVQAPA